MSIAPSSRLGAGLARVGDATQQREFVNSLERGLSVIRAFSRENPRPTLAEVARTTGLTRPTARRFLITLQALGYVGEQGRHFYLRPRVLELGYAYLSSFSLAEVAQAHLDELAGEVNESASASVLDGEEIVYVAAAAVSRMMMVSLGVGRRLPAYATSMGRVLLAHLQEDELDDYFASAELNALTDRTITDESELRQLFLEIRATGRTIVDEEFEDGVKAVAVPIRDRSGQVIAAINTCVPVARAGGSILERDFLPKLLEAARRIESSYL